jgi:hypothetical protein
MLVPHAILNKPQLHAPMWYLFDQRMYFIYKGTRNPIFNDNMGRGIP